MFEGGHSESMQDGSKLISTTVIIMYEEEGRDIRLIVQ